MNKKNSVRSVNLQVIMDVVGIIDVWIPGHVLEEGLSSANSSSELLAEIETYVDEEYNLADVYYFTPTSNRSVNEIFNKFNNLEKV